MSARRAAAALAVAGTVLAAACGESEPEAPAAESVPSSSAPSPEVTVRDDRKPPTPNRDATPLPGGPTQSAVHDLAARLGVAPERVAVVRVVEVTWRDGSIGCPVPGMRYTQALTDGTLIELEVDGTTYEYHSGGRRGPFLCETPEPPLRVHG